MKVSVQSIIEAGRVSGRVFTANQAQRILDRHKQLVKEGQSLRREKRNQVNDLWNHFEDREY